MGTLLPNSNDTDVINQLNQQFIGANFLAVRKYITQTEDFFDPNPTKGYSLARASWRLNIAPTAGLKPRKRWFAFLSPRILGSTNISIIQTAIHKALCNDKSAPNAPPNQTANIVGIIFGAQYSPLVPANNYDIDLSWQSAGSTGNDYIRKITLLVDHEIPSSEPGDNDPIPAPNEKPPAHPVAPIAPLRRPPRKQLKVAAKNSSKKAAAKTSKKGTRKKPVKKASKKAAKKTRK